MGIERSPHRGHAIAAVRGLNVDIEVRVFCVEIDTGHAFNGISCFKRGAFTSERCWEGCAKRMRTFLFIMRILAKRLNYFCYKNERLLIAVTNCNS